jgi:hypothetical protein
MAAGQRLLLVDSQFDIDAKYGIGLPIAGVYRGNLNNGGETLVLMAPDGLTELFRVTYDGADPWPEAADGDGRSLVLVDGKRPNDPAAWRPSLSDGGSPGTLGGDGFTGNPDEDLDGDGINSFTEFAMGTSDLEPNGPADQPVFLPDGNGGWEYRFPVSLAARDVTARIEFSNDLVTWSDNPTAAEHVSSVVSGDQYLRTYRAPAPAPSNRLFIRVRYRSNPTAN